MNKFKKALLVLTASLFSVAVLPAKADVIDFTGAYAIGSWTTAFTTTDASGASLGEGGSVDTSGAPAEVVLIEPDCYSGGACVGGYEYGVQFYNTAAFDAIFSFDWDYAVVDGCCSGVYVYAGDLSTPETWMATLSANGTAGSGTYSVAVSAGDIIGWGNFTNDDCCGANTLTISNFSLVSTAVTEPETLFILSLGLLGLVTRRRKNLV